MEMKNTTFKAILDQAQLLEQIFRQPRHVTVKKLVEQLMHIAVTESTSLKWGKHGHARVVLSAATYVSYSTTAFIITSHPGAYQLLN